jgi:hypothetical protein
VLKFHGMDSCSFVCLFNENASTEKLMLYLTGKEIHGTGIEVSWSVTLCSLVDGHHLSEYRAVSIFRFQDKGRMFLQHTALRLEICTSESQGNRRCENPTIFDSIG